MGFRANLTCTSRSFFSDPRGGERVEKMGKLGLGSCTSYALGQASLLRRTPTYIHIFQGRNETKSAENNHILGQSHQEANQALLLTKEQSLSLVT